MAAFRLFGRPLLIHFALLGRKRKKIKSKQTEKLREKRTSIAAVRAKLGQFDTFQTHLLSHCRLPLSLLTPYFVACLRTTVALNCGTTALLLDWYRCYHY